MSKLHLFIDTHDKRTETFPAELSRQQFSDFFAAYQEACQAEGVILVRSHVGYQDGRAFCLTLAPDADSVRRAHQRVGLPFDTITEVESASPADTFFAAGRQVA